MNKYFFFLNVVLPIVNPVPSALDRKLTSIAFWDLNPFRMKHVKNRRAVHLQRLQAELRELEKLQKEYSSENSQRKDNALDLIPSEDDDDA